MSRYKYKLEVDFECEEECSVDGVLDGSTLYDPDFVGAVTSARLRRQK